VPVAIRMNSTTVIAWMGESAREMRTHRDLLVQLDAAIGDGDHGINMTRGFDAVVAALDGDPAQPPGRLLILSGRTLISAVGGASGPLWGSALRNAGRSLGDTAEFDGAELLAALEAALAAIVDLGAAVVGDKTMVDTLAPAIATLRSELAAGRSLDAALAAAVGAAEEGMRGTVPLQARKGRASYLGERSIGHQDPGATSAALILGALQRTVAGTA
jgi:dihydroxyacetone kinase-like protein